MPQIDDELVRTTARVRTAVDGALGHPARVAIGQAVPATGGAIPARPVPGRAVPTVLVRSDDDRAEATVFLGGTTTAYVAVALVGELSSEAAEWPVADGDWTDVVALLTAVARGSVVRRRPRLSIRPVLEIDGGRWTFAGHRWAEQEEANAATPGTAEGVTADGTAGNPAPGGTADSPAAAGAEGIAALRGALDPGWAVVTPIVLVEVEGGWPHVFASCRQLAGWLERSDDVTAYDAAGHRLTITGLGRRQFAVSLADPAADPELLRNVLREYLHRYGHDESVLRRPLPEVLQEIAGHAPR
ncbi:MAG: hypothetical protein EPO13_11520 [Actinomycetota bacterium]|nr:MAG: hypothetical protein EPO13_11520 [Actinomycetota bacterium]